MGGRDYYEFCLICDSLYLGGKMYWVMGVVNIDIRLSVFIINFYYFKDLFYFNLEVVLCDLCLKEFFFLNLWLKLLKMYYNIVNFKFRYSIIYICVFWIYFFKGYLLNNYKFFFVFEYKKLVKRICILVILIINFWI